jgi:hypothetical protein
MKLRCVTQVDLREGARIKQDEGEAAWLAWLKREFDVAPLDQVPDEIPRRPNAGISK